MFDEFVRLYLERIGLELDEKFPRNGETLNKIQYAHITTIPYENIDILKNIPLSLDIDKLFDKIILRKRGGYCFELNALYAELLRRLGYHVESYMARYLRGETALPMRRHRVLIVTCPLDDKKYLCDVGVGAISPRYPIPFQFGVEFSQFGELYRLRKGEFLGNILEECHKGEWREVFSFTDEKQLEIDYIMPSFYCEKHPDSIFNKDYIVAIKTENGRITLNGNNYREYVGDEIVKDEELDMDGKDNIIKEIFGIQV